MKKITLLILLLNMLFAVNAQTYNFNTETDQEGWTVSNGTVAVSGGIMTLTPVSHKNPNIQLNGAAINATVNGYVHLTIKNHSNIADEIRLVIRNAADNGNTFVNIDMTKEDADFKTYDLDLSAADGWSGNVNAITIRFTERNTIMDGVTHNVEIDNIVFDNNAVLNVESLEKFKFAFYPNPSKGEINFSSVKPIEQVQMYSLLGQEVLNVKLDNQPNQSIDVSTLAVGIYNMKVNIDGAVGVVKFVKK